MTKQYDFDKIIDRHGTNALKTDVLTVRYGRSDLLPLWVADMDFETPDFIMEALRERLNHPVLGYTKNPDGYYPAIQKWLLTVHGWTIQSEWLRYIPGVVKGIGFAVNVFTKPGDRIIIQPPVYHPFHLVPRGNGREIVYNPLTLLDDGLYAMDFNQLEQTLSNGDCKLLILSNPHNPGGIVWDKATLLRLADLCDRYHTLVIADEIHADLTLYGHQYTPFATVSEAAKLNSITFGAPSKTFNIAGVVSSFAVIPNDAVRKAFYTWLSANELDEPTIFAPIATEVAYIQGYEWLQALKRYLEGTIDFVDDYLSEHNLGIKAIKPQATYLVWLDCRALKLTQADLVDLFVNKAHLALNDGAMFGPGGDGFMRMNVATPRRIIEQALENLRQVIEK
ncbi:cystathionine beta-lyase [Bacteroidia bacterium]|nr:cystathionine beta-lyase [Bacteroidia bacterium]